MRHAGRSAHHHHALDVGLVHLAVAQHFAHGLQGARTQGGSGGFKFGAVHGDINTSDRQVNFHWRNLVLRQRFFAGAGGSEQQRLVFLAVHLQRGLRQDPIGQRPVVVVAAQGRVAASGQHLKHAHAQAQDGNIKGAAAQVVNGVDAFGRVVQAISNGSGCGLIDQAQDVQAGELRRVFGGLALRVVKISRHGDDRAIHIVVKAVFGAKAQRGQNLGAHFHRAFFTGNGAHLDHAGCCHQAVRQALGVRNVSQTAPHQALNRRDGVTGVAGLLRQRVIANLAALGVEVTHHAGQNHPALGVGQAFGNTVAHSGHQRMRGAQVNANGQTPRVGIGRLARLRNL